jgi:hypothetical protein
MRLGSVEEHDGGVLLIQAKEMIERVYIEPLIDGLCEVVVLKSYCRALQGFLWSRVNRFFLINQRRFYI